MEEKLDSVTVKDVAYLSAATHDEPAPEYDINKVDYLILTSKKDWPYYAHCNVDMSTGEITFGECRIPN